MAAIELAGEVPGNSSCYRWQAAIYLTGLKVPVFPPSEALRNLSEKIGLIRPKTTTLQMAKTEQTKRFMKRNRLALGRCT